MTEKQRSQRLKQAQVVFEAAQILKAHHASHELVAAVADWADKIATTEGQ